MRLDPKVREILARLPGWEIEKKLGSGHLRLRHPESGATYVVAHSPGEGRAIANAVAGARRQERAASAARRHA
ncbi:hicA toxin superfamily protein [Microcystis phage MJing1]|nr:hicA toxin superfamily protein [Microcystis phage MJing1]